MNSKIIQQRFLFPSLLVLLVVLSVISSDLYLASFPHLVDYFNTTHILVNYTLIVYFIGFAVSIFVCAPLADNFGIRKILLFGLALYVGASILCLFSTSINNLILGRFLQSFGGCCGSIFSRSLVKEYYTGNNRVKLFSYLFAGMAIGVALAPILGGGLHYYFGWKANFLFMGGYGAIILMMTYLIVPKTEKKESNTRNFIKDYSNILTNHQYISYTLLISFLWMGFITFSIRAPFMFIQLLGTSQQNFGIFYSITICGLVLGTMLAKRISLYSGINLAISHGTTVSLIGAFLIFVNPFNNLFSMIIPMGIYFLGMGIVLPNCQEAVSRICHTQANVAFSMMYFAQMFLGAIGGMIIAHLTRDSLLPFNILIMVCAFSAKIIYYSRIKKNSKLEEIVVN